MQIITAFEISSQEADPINFDGVNFILTEVKGLEHPTVRLPRYNLPGSSGAYISNALYGERRIAIKGVVNAPDNSIDTYLANRSKLINCLAIARDSSGNLQPQTITITLQNGDILTTTGYIDTPLQMGFSPDQVGFEEFQITFVAPDPNLYSSTSLSGTAQLPVGGGTAIPTAIPISLAPSSGGSVTLINSGSTTSYPLITLNGPLTNPYITNQRTGQFLKISYTINVGDLPVIINCSTQTITQGTNNKTGIQSSDSSFWGILSGTNVIGFSATGGSGDCTVSFNPTFIGV